ncbi:hypothetical protein [Brevundimonas sp. Root1423]|uniref:hypothetical protein n=1 Tax=Brevundimonas sp. Root1423 TaxID=1736462 RepID=UPI0006FDFECF|nr:hypothetical protein [Brevundimonas sp. Root1423]KQY75438.1 hypothetical protein ASD25_12960 [Brevundimonas sp. Root1423]
MSNHVGNQGVLLAALAVVGVASLAATPASAQALDERFWLEGSGYFPGIETKINVSRPGQPGTDIDAENDLGMEDTDTLPAVYAGWRMSPRWILTGEFYALDREANVTLGRTIEFDGSTYPIGVSVDSRIASDVYRATVGYSFIRNDYSELGASIGLHATDFDIELTGEAQIGPAVRQVVTRNRTFLAPMPTIGVYGTYEISPKVILNGRVDFLSLEVDEYGGGITNVQASAAYRFSRNFSAGLAWRYVAYDLQVEKTEYNADIDYNFNGPSIFARISF